jgi:hypothetical protein
LFDEEWCVPVSSLEGDGNGACVSVKCVLKLPSKIDHDSGHIRFELSYTDRMDRIEVDDRGARPDLHASPCTIQNETIWIPQPKWGAGKSRAANNADLDVLIDLGCLYLLDHHGRGLEHPLRSF